jgi:hypothetical protein
MPTEAKQIPKFKFSKGTVHFEHPAEGKDHCGQCTYFQGAVLDRCEIVAGEVKAQDWCAKFERK